MRKRFLFISWTSRHQNPYLDPSVRYRCYNVAQELLKQGHQANVISQQAFEDNINNLSSYDVYVLHRPYLTSRLASFLLKKCPNKQVIADFDDLIFDIENAESTSMYRSRDARSRTVRDYIAKTAEALDLIGKCTVSTTPIASRLNKIFPHLETLVTPNVLDASFIGISKVARNSIPFEKRPYTFGYFSGTATHNKDFEMVASTLRYALKNNGAKLLLAGEISTPKIFNDVANQITNTPLVSFHKLPFIMSQCKFALAPLENTIFNNSKSGLKYFEAALSGCMVIATPIPDIDRFSSPNLAKCSSSNDWAKELLTATKIPKLSFKQSKLEIEALESKISSSSFIDSWLTFTKI